MRREDKRFTWGTIWFGIGVGAVIALIAAPELPTWSINALTAIACIFFPVAAFQFGWLNAPRTLGSFAKQILVLILIWGPLYWLRGRITHADKKSRLEVVNVVGVQAQNNNAKQAGFFFNIFYADEGQIAATAMAHRTVTLSTDHLLSDSELEKNRAESLQISPAPIKTVDEIQPGLEPKHYFSAPDEDAAIEAFGSRAQDVLAGKARFYIFVAMKYRDAELPATRIRVTEFCGWFINNFDVWHNCGNRIYEQDTK